MLRVLSFYASPRTQTPGCETWAHTQCLYGKDRAPRLAFCYGCHDTLRALAAAEKQAQQAGGKPLPPVHTGRQIRLRSRVIVCRGPRGLEEGVVTMFGEGNARVHFKVRGVVPVLVCMGLRAYIVAHGAASNLMNEPHKTTRRHAPGRRRRRSGSPRRPAASSPWSRSRRWVWKLND